MLIRSITLTNLGRAFRAKTFTSGVIAYLMMTWSSVMAATIVVARDPGLSLDPIMALIACFLSALTGGTTLAIRINNIMMGDEVGIDGQPKPIVRPWLFAAAHMGGSLLGGCVGFVLAKANEWGPWNVLLGVIIMSFMGAKGIEMIAERWLGAVKFTTKA